MSKRDSRTFSQIERIKGNTIKTIDLPTKFNEKSDFSWEGELKQTPKSSSPARESSVKKSTGKTSQKDGSKNSRASRTGSSGSSKSDNKPARKKQKSAKSAAASTNDKQSNKPSKNKQAKRNQSGNGEKVADNEQKPSKSRQQKEQDEKEKMAELENVAIPPAIDKAAERNKNSLKPAKGIWGIVKSFIPKF